MIAFDANKEEITVETIENQLFIVNHIDGKFKVDWQPRVLDILHKDTNAVFETLDRVRINTETSLVKHAITAKVEDVIATIESNLQAEFEYINVDGMLNGKFVEAEFIKLGLI